MGVENPTGTIGTNIAPATLGTGGTARFLVPSGQACTQPTGACCLLTGTCQPMTAVNCQTQNGVYAGTGMSCTAAGGSVACRKSCTQDSDCVAPFGFVCVNPGFGAGGCIGTAPCQ